MLYILLHHIYTYINNVYIHCICIYKYIYRLVLRRNQSLYLKSKLIGCFLLGSDFCWGDFRIESSTGLFSNAAIA